MTLILSDGFDTYTTMTQGGWTSSGGSGNLSAIAGRLSGNAIQINNGNGTIGQYFIGQNLTTAIIGFAWNGDIYTNSAQRIFSFQDSTTEQLGIRLDTLQRITVTRNGTVLATELSPVTVNSTWYYFELKVVFGSGVSGSYALRRNGVAISGIPDVAATNTISTANAYANVLGLQGTANIASSYDDLYLLTTAGSAPLNDFLGDIRVVPLLPTAVGTNTNWTKVGAAATNWQSVNENPPDGDTTYVASSTINQTDTYNYADLPSNTSTVLAVYSRFSMRKDDAGSIRTVTTRVRSGGTEANAPTSVTPSIAYQLLGIPMEVNPVSTIAWTVADVNTAEFGPRLLS